jgi:prepilin-type processing-associated H-X9-DG protein
LVVISIIGMLMALLLPAVQSARESGRANTCRNNMRNLGLAIIQYEGSRGKYPGYVNDIDTTNDPTMTTTDNDRRSWTFVILPFMDHRSLYDQFRNSVTPNKDIKSGLEITLCPSNPPDGTTSTSTSYVVNSGQADRFANEAEPGSPYRRSWDFAGNGVFHRQDPQPKRIPVVSMTQAYIAGGDGLGVTLMMSENADLQGWVGGFMNGADPVVPMERWTGFTYHDADGQPGADTAANTLDPWGINVRFGQSKGDPNYFVTTYMRPSSFHPNGVNVMFCDGHVRFIADTIAYGVYQALMTPRGKSAIYAYNTSGDAAIQPLPVGHAATLVVDENAIP